MLRVTLLQLVDGVMINMWINVVMWFRYKSIELHSTINRFPFYITL